MLVMAIQDIAVDGWALTLLTKENISYASSVQNVGLMVGGLISFNFYIPLNSVKISNDYFRSLPLDVSVNNFSKSRNLF